MSPVERFLANKTFKRFDAQGRFPTREGSLGTQAARPQKVQIFGDQIFRSVKDARILRSAALDGRLSISERRAGKAEDGLFMAPRPTGGGWISAGAERRRLEADADSRERTLTSGASSAT